MRWIIVALPSELAEIQLRLSKLDAAYSESVYILAKLTSTQAMADTVVRLSADVVIDACRDASYSNSVKAMLTDLAPLLAYESASGLRAIIDHLQPLLNERKVLQTVRTQLSAGTFSHNLDAWFKQWKDLGLREYGLCILEALVFERTEGTAARVRLPRADRHRLNADGSNIVYTGFHRRSVDSKHLILRSLGQQRFDENEWVHDATDPTQIITSPQAAHVYHTIVAVDDACWTGANARTHVEELEKFVAKNTNITQVILRFSYAMQRGLDDLQDHIERLSAATSQAVRWSVSIPEDGLIGEKADPRPKMLFCKSERLRNDAKAFNALNEIGWQVFGDVDADHWGYGGCAGTLLFQHSIPDNTLPLLTCGGRGVTFNGKTISSWMPLVSYKVE